MHNEFVENLILQGVVNGNILPLTSTCNMNCLFCSHKQNPADLLVYHIPPRDLRDIKETISYMNPACPVIIGESVTRIIEGEPFTHPDIDGILELIRDGFAETPIRITTNGSLLDEKRVAKLAALSRVELNLSLNSATLEGRRLLMGDAQAQRSVRSPLLLAEYGLAFHGSVVAMPHLVGWQDIRCTVKYLADAGAVTVRVFLPGFTKFSPNNLRFGPELLTELDSFLENLRQETDTPLLCEPPIIGELTPVVIGVISASPAANAGVNRGDVVVAVDGAAVATRVEAFETVFRSASPLLDLKRGNKRLQVRLSKNSNVSSGLVMEYDLHPRLCLEIGQMVRSRRANNTLLLTGVLAAPVLEMALDRFYRVRDEGLGGSNGDRDGIKVLAVPNRYFGGSIQAAGLLTVADFSEALQEYCETEACSLPDLVLLPGLAFDNRGRDLTGRFYMELGEMYGVDVEIVSC